MGFKLMTEKIIKNKRKKEDKKLNIHIVDSVKGGSGKSTFSAKLCAFLSLDEDVNPCVIDLDLLGTSWKYIFGNSIEDSSSGSKKKWFYLNDLVKDYDYYIKTIFTQEINFNNVLGSNPSDTHKFKAIFSNPNPNAKNEYRISDNQYTPNISYDVFCNVVLDLIDFLGDDGYTDIVLDMPPNSDPYSDKVLHYCLKPQFKHNTSLYMVSSTNIAHIMSTFDWYSDFVKDTKSSHFAIAKNLLKDYSLEKKQDWFENSQFKFFFVFNQTRILKTEKDLDERALINLCADKTLIEKLAYYFVKYDDAYCNSVDDLSVSDVIKSIELQPFDNTSFLFYDETDSNLEKIWDSEIITDVEEE